MNSGEEQQLGELGEAGTQDGEKQTDDTTAQQENQAMQHDNSSIKSKADEADVHHDEVTEAAAAGDPQTTEEDTSSQRTAEGTTTTCTEVATTEDDNSSNELSSSLPVEVSHGDAASENGKAAATTDPAEQSESVTASEQQDVPAALLPAVTCAQDLAEGSLPAAAQSSKSAVVDQEPLPEPLTAPAAHSTATLTSMADPTQQWTPPTIAKSEDASHTEEHDTPVHHDRGHPADSTSPAATDDDVQPTAAVAATQPAVMVQSIVLAAEAPAAKEADDAAHKTAEPALQQPAAEHQPPAKSQGSNNHHEAVETAVERLTMPTAMRMLHTLEKTQGNRTEYHIATGVVYKGKKLSPDEMTAMVDRLCVPKHAEDHLPPKLHAVKLAYQDNKEVLVPVKEVTKDDNIAYMANLYDRCQATRTKTQQALAEKYLQPLIKPKEAKKA